MKLRSLLPSLVIAIAIAVGLWYAKSHRRGAGDSGRPQFGAWGFDLAGRDTTVKPGDDFFRYANGGWVARTEIPADKPGTSLRLLMSDRVEQRLHEMLEHESASGGHEPATLRGKVGAFYKAFMDTARAESLGVRPLAPTLAAVRAAVSRDSLAALAGRTGSDFPGSPFAYGIDVDYKDPSRYAVYVGQGGLGLPDRDYYLQPAFAAKKQAYQAYVARMLSLAEWPEADARAADVVAYETAIAAASWDRAHQRDPVATYNPFRAASLDSLAPGFAWRPFLASAGFGGVDRVVVAEVSAFPKLAALWARTPVPVLQAWLAFTVLDNAAPYLASPFQRAAFELRGQALSGQQAPSARWKRGVHAVSGGDYLAGDRFDRFGNMGWAVGELYTERWFPPAARAQIESLVVNLSEAYRVRIQRLAWMGPETKAKALRKLETYQIKVGYPDHGRDYATLVVRDDDLVGDVRRAAAFEWGFQCGRLGGPVDRSDWGMTPQTNDAYNGSLRDIVFPAGILQAPIFDPAADPAINYGAVGGVIGHELTHGFDDQGRKIDADGKLADWWTPKDDAEFQARAARLGRQYDHHEPLPGVHVNGALTMGENIADLGGVVLALEAYRASLHGRPAPVIDGLTGDQRVFLGWAQAWRGKTRDEALRRQVVSDPHSPRMFRVNGPVQNVDEWYDAFGVKPGDALYLPPEERVRIW
jgi:putative endopeptidase